MSLCYKYNRLLDRAETQWESDGQQPEVLHSLCPSLWSSGPHQGRPPRRPRRRDNPLHHGRWVPRVAPGSLPQLVLLLPSGRHRRPPDPRPLLPFRAQARQHLLPDSLLIPSPRFEQEEHDEEDDEREQYSERFRLHSDRPEQILQQDRECGPEISWNRATEEVLVGERSETPQPNRQLAASSWKHRRRLDNPNPYTHTCKTHKMNTAIPEELRSYSLSLHSFLVLINIIVQLMQKGRHWSAPLNSLATSWGTPIKFFPPTFSPTKREEKDKRKTYAFWREGAASVELYTLQTLTWVDGNSVGFLFVFNVFCWFISRNVIFVCPFCASSAACNKRAVPCLCMCVCVCVYDFRSLLTISSIGRVQSAATMREQDYVRTTVVMGRGSEIENVYDL